MTVVIMVSQEAPFHLGPDGLDNGDLTLELDFGGPSAIGEPQGQGPLATLIGVLVDRSSRRWSSSFLDDLHPPERKVGDVVHAALVGVELEVAPVH